jgi:hypothetical protein
VTEAVELALEMFGLECMLLKPELPKLGPFIATGTVAGMEVLLELLLLLGAAGGSTGTVAGIDSLELRSGIASVRAIPTLSEKSGPKCCTGTGTVSGIEVDPWYTNVGSADARLGWNPITGGVRDARLSV